MSTAPSAGRLEGRHAVVTGAGSGIGRAIAHRLASEGARVSLLGRRAAALEETARDAEGTSAVLPCDVRDAGATRAAMAAAAAAHGPIHVVVANAGVGGRVASVAVGSDTITGAFTNSSTARASS